MKVAVITDTHLGARNDSQAFNEYFLKSIDNFITFVEQNDIKVVFHLGDVFDRRKYINFQTLYTWRKAFFERLEKLGVELHIICGNHDTYFKNTNEINGLKEILDNKYSNIVLYEDEPKEINVDGTKVLMVPWISDENQKKCLTALKKTSAHVCFGHFDIVGFEMYKGSVNDSHGFDPKVFQNFELVLTGHYHHKSSKDNIHYLGAPYEIIASDYKDPRGFHILDTESLVLEFIQNDLTMFRRVIYDDTNVTYESIQMSDFSHFKNTIVKVVVTKKEDAKVFDAFIEKLNESEPHNLIIIDQILNEQDEIDELLQSKDTKEILKDYVKSLNFTHEKELLSLMEDVYTEAITMDENVI